MSYPQCRAITVKMNRERFLAPIWTCGIRSKFMQLIAMRENILLNSKRLSTLNTNINVYTISRRLRGAGNGTPLQYSCLESPTEEPGRLRSMRSLKSQTRLRNLTFTFTFHFHALEKEMATHSSVLAWRIPGMAEPSGLPSMRSHGVGHD